MYQQIGYQATDDSPVPRWAIVHGGNEYVLLFILPDRKGGKDRRAIVSSGVLKIGSAREPFLALLTYMILSYDYSDEELERALGIPAYCSSSPEPESQESEESEEGSCKAEEMEVEKMLIYPPLEPGMCVVIYKFPTNTNR
jgi:hypothetical protein